MNNQGVGMTPERKKLLILLSIIAAVFILIPLFIFVIVSVNNAVKVANQTHVIIIDNLSDYSAGINKDVFTGIEARAYAVTAQNITDPAPKYHGVIRKNTFVSSPGNSVSFTLDIPSIKLSWKVVQAVDSNGAPLSDPLVQCIPSDQAIYPVSGSCKDGSNGGLSAAQQAFLPIVKDLPLDGQTFSINYGNSPDKTDAYALFVTYYTNTGQQDALNALQTLGYNPSNYEIIYTNATTPAD